MNESLAYIANCLSDISTALDQIAQEQRLLLDLVRQRQDMENRLWHLEKLVHHALMGEDEDDALRS